MGQRIFIVMSGNSVKSIIQNISRKRCLSIILKKAKMKLEFEILSFVPSSKWWNPWMISLESRKGYEDVNKVTEEKAEIGWVLRKVQFFSGRQNVIGVPFAKDSRETKGKRYKGKGRKSGRVKAVEESYDDVAGEIWSGEREGRGSETGLRGRYRRRESWLLQGRSEGWQAYRSEREAWLTADEAVTRDESRRDAVRTEKLFPSCHHLFEGREGGAGQPAAPPLSYMRVCAVFVRVCGAAVATIRQGIVANAADAAHDVAVNAGQTNGEGNADYYVPRDSSSKKGWKYVSLSL